VSYGISEVMADYERIEERTRLLEIAESVQREIIQAVRDGGFLGQPITERLTQRLSAFLMPYERKLQMLMGDPSIRIEVRTNPSDSLEMFIDITRVPSATPPRYVLVFVERPFIA